MRHRLKRRLGLLALALALIPGAAAGAPTPAGAEPEPEPETAPAGDAAGERPRRNGLPLYSFGTGGKRGGFLRIGKALRRGLERTSATIDIDLRETKGSCENIRMLLQGELDFALVQYDVAAEAFKASRVAERTVEPAEGADETEHHSGWMCDVTSEMARKSHLRLVAALTDGAVHMLVRRPVRLSSLAGVGDHPIYIGKESSGSFETGKVIVGAAGLTVDDLNRLEAGSSKAFAAMRGGDLLVMLRTTEPGHPDIADMIASGVASVNPLPDKVIDRLIDGYPYYRVCQIEPKTYPGLEFGLPTICVTTVLLTTDNAEHEAHRAEHNRATLALLDAADDAAAHPEDKQLGIRPRWHSFAEQEPIPLHPVADDRERSRRRGALLRYGGITVVLLTLLLLLRRYLRRRGILRDRLSSNFEGHLSNPLVPFAAFAVLVLISTVIVWSIEHDSNAHLRTLDDSFWEINTFATGNFSAETVKSSTARFIGAMATIAGLGFLAWFTAALTSLFGRDQTRLFQRLKGHIVILNFREEMLPLIRLLRSPGPTQFRSIHVVVSDGLPKRVRLHLARIKGLVIHHENPEVPSDLVGLRLPRAARVVVLQGDHRYNKGPRYHPLRITRAVHQACGADHHQRALTAAQAAEISPEQSAVLPPALTTLATAGHRTPRQVLPSTLVEAGDHEPRELFDPFRGWVIPVRGQELADAWLATASADPAFPQLFHSLVTFDEDNSEVYTAELPEWFHGNRWRLVRRVLYTLEGRCGVVPLGLFRSSGAEISAGADLQRRLLVNPDPSALVDPGDRVIALAEDEADLKDILRRSQRLTQELLSRRKPESA